MAVNGGDKRMFDYPKILDALVLPLYTVRSWAALASWLQSLVDAGTGTDIAVFPTGPLVNSATRYNNESDAHRAVVCGETPAEYQIAHPRRLWTPPPPQAKAWPKPRGLPGRRQAAAPGTACQHGIQPFQRTRWPTLRCRATQVDHVARRPTMADSADSSTRWLSDVRVRPGLET
jgi:hypothetical protein